MKPRNGKPPEKATNEREVGKTADKALAVIEEKGAMVREQEFDVVHRPNFHHDL